LIIPNKISGRSVTSISSYILLDNVDNNLNIIVVPNTVNEIGKGAFANASKLVSLTIPFVGKSRDAIGYEATIGYLFGENQYTDSYETYYNLPYPGMDQHNSYLPTTLTEISISDANNISDSAFAAAIKVETINLNHGVTSIGDYAFSFMLSLETIDLSNSLESIGLAAFWSTPSLGSIYIPSSVTIMGEMAFGYNFGEPCVLTIYTSSDSRPFGWDFGWNPKNIEVVWSYNE